MCKKELETDEAIVVVDSDTTPDLSSEGHTDNAQTASEMDMDATTKPSTDASLPEENGDGSPQTDVVPDATSTTEPSASTNKFVELHLNALAEVNESLLALQDLFEKQITRNQNQSQMFDVIYREMKDYKENSILETIHKPIIHNLIRFYDSFVLVESQFDSISEAFGAIESLSGDISDEQLEKICSEEQAEKLPQLWTNIKKELLQFRANLENLRFELEEVLYRLDVSPYEEHPVKLNRKLHKTLGTMQTDNPDKDQEVAQIHKTGFYWHEKIFRPEEVTILRYTPSTDEPEETADRKATVENPTDEKEMK